MEPGKIVFAFVLVGLGVAGLTALLVAERRRRYDRQLALALAVLAAVVSMPSLAVTLFWLKGVLSGMKIFVSILAAVFGWIGGMVFADSPVKEEPVPASKY